MWFWFRGERTVHHDMNGATDGGDDSSAAGSKRFSARIIKTKCIFHLYLLLLVPFLLSVIMKVYKTFFATLE